MPTICPRRSTCIRCAKRLRKAFILDVLSNYTPYKLAFKLAHSDPYNISQKVQVVVEHRENVHRCSTVRPKRWWWWAAAWRRCAGSWPSTSTSRRGYKLGTLVAFSGEVNDTESGPDPFTETSKRLNPDLNGRDIREAFETDEYQILLVANKFQTGFDQPLLCGMYVDRRLAGIQAVQTLSRLNRAYRGLASRTPPTSSISSTTPRKSSQAFKTYYETAELDGVTDPNLTSAKLDATGYYDDHEVERVLAVELNPNVRQAELCARWSQWPTGC